VSFEYLANLRKFKNLFERWAGVMKRGVLINEKPNEGGTVEKKCLVYPAFNESNKICYYIDSEYPEEGSRTKHRNVYQA
jgi:hypothetical protein